MVEFTFYAIDFEGSLASGILEYGCVEASSTQGIISVETQLCKNRTHIPSQESNSHKIYEGTVQTASDFSIYVPKFLAWRSQAFFCAHNATYENMLLHAYCPVVLRPYTLDSHPKGQWGPWLDTYFLYKNILKKDDHTLKNLVEIFQLQNLLEKIAGKFCPPLRKKYHCALYDALACALLLLNFIHHLSKHKPTLLELLQLSSPKELTKNLQQPLLF